MIRLLLVEDSATIREMFIFVLATEPDIEIVATAKDGEEAIALAKSTHPDIILMDIEMPKVNGYEAAQKIMATNPVPILLMSALWDTDEIKEKSLYMNLGVLGVYEKPYGAGHPKFKELYGKIISDIRLMSDVHVVPRMPSTQKSLKKEDIVEKREKKSFILIGASTGGPPVLHMIFKALPAYYPLPILLVQHMGGNFIDNLIEWLDKDSAVKVKKAQDGEIIAGGYVYIAPAGYHLTIERKRIKLCSIQEEESGFPSVSKLFSSVNPSDASDAIAILLSGMGSDGAEEILKLKQNGALTLAQDEATSVVFGMAKEAIKCGGIMRVLSPEAIIELLLENKNNQEKDIYG